VSRSEHPCAEQAGDFARRLLAWHRRHGRHDLPWQGGHDPYRVWLSEIMLQQTQVATVLGYFQRFVERFPDVRALARARSEDVMSAWAGLGYYARARNLHACARAIVEHHFGRFPTTAEALAALPGIGRSTAGAIAAFCFAERAAILDGNARRVLARHWAIDGDPASSSVAKRLWERAQRELPSARRMAMYTQAIMDLGATVCTRLQPDCPGCPVKASCLAHRLDRTAELPGARARRVRPVRSAHVLVALAAGAVLLQQRAPQGIWGGLLCLPQFASKAQLLRRARSLGAGARSLVPLPPRRHVLTHLTLAIEPYLAVTDASTPQSESDSSRWYALGQIDQAPLPAPHRALLREVLGPHPNPSPATRERG
jgi:A/G-specific adenine glycosylase